MKLFAVASLISGITFAQNSQRNCGTMQHLEFLKSNDKHLESRMNDIETQTARFVEQQASMKTSAVINIPVVVHVLYNTTSQNISDTQIKSQIDVLNEDFRKLNADRTNVPSAFSGLAADVEINFCLASKSPSGASTTGIVRKSTTATSFIDDDKVKYSSSGGDDAWNTNQYLNLWVCNLGNGLLGYAQFPGGPSATDGVVILYSAFGRTGTLSAPYNKGRTATHEVGHWLNLRHIWGDASCGSDLVNDTPTQQTSNYGCPTYPHRTCSNTTSGDMFMNYMDYTDDGCMNMFTAGQKTRMQALFASGGSRAGLLTSQGCGATTTTTTPTQTTSTSSNTLVVGNGTGTTTTPYGTYYMDAKTQYIITKAELVAAGYSSTNKIIKSLAFNIASASSQVMNGFTIKMKHTTASSFASSSFYTNSDMTTVYSGNISASAGWKTHAFTTPFTYNGTDNLLIEICFDNSAYSTDSKTYYTATSSYNTLYLRQDVASGGICNNTTGTRTYNRPNMKMVFSSSTAIVLTNEPTVTTDNNYALRTIPKINHTDFELAPNPTNSDLTVSYSIDNEESAVSIKIYNMMGEVIGTFEPKANGIGNQTASINIGEQTNINQLPTGIYLCSLNIDGNVQTKKFMLVK